jgi:hypothetical protein
VADDVLIDGREAERLLNDATLTKVFAKVEEDYIARWKVEANKDKREHLHACVTAVGDIRAKLESMKVTKGLVEAENRKFGRPNK